MNDLIHSVADAVGCAIAILAAVGFVALLVCIVVLFRILTKDMLVEEDKEEHDHGPE